MRIAILSLQGEATPLAYRLAQDGHQVSLILQEPTEGLCDGYVNHKLDGGPYDLAWIDSPLFEASKIEVPGAKPWPVHGLAATFATDRHFTMMQARAAGWRVPRFYMRDTVRGALAVIEGQDRIWRVGPANGPWSWEIPATSQLQQRVITSRLGRIDADLDRPDPQLGWLFLQEYVPGLEILIGGIWHNGIVDRSSLWSALEARRFGAGDTGPEVGCAAVLAWWWRDFPQKLWKHTLGLWEPMLQSFKYDGPLAVRVTIGQDDMPYIRDVLPFWPVPVLMALSECYGGSLCDIMRACIEETPLEKLALDRRTFGLALRLSVPPYPIVLDKVRPMPDKVIIEPEAAKHFWGVELIRTSDMLDFCPRRIGLVGYLTAKGSSWARIDATIHYLLDHIGIYDLYYRVDAVTYLLEKLYGLHNKRYIDLGGYNDGKESILDSGRDQAQRRAPQATGDTGEQEDTTREAPASSQGEGQARCQGTTGDSAQTVCSPEKAAIES